MTKDEYLALMEFPSQWKEWGMYPDELSQTQISRYVPGNETGAEHDRNEAFHWWIKKEMSEDQFEKLERLAHLDPDKGLGADVREHLSRMAKNRLR